jgi:two-component system cell cycle response regulator DivK
MVEFADGAEHVIRILYVEENEDNVYMLKTRLELTGAFEVLVAEDGEKGCAMAALEQPALILMDLEMPVVDGWEAARRLKNDPATRQIPIIGLSAHALEADREKALAAGCEEFDTKPVEFERLLGKIRRLLDSSKPMVEGQCA